MRRTGEITRIIIFGVLGFILVFLVQPWLYQSRILRVRDSLRIFQNSYLSSAVIVFVASVAATLLWYVLASTAKTRSPSDFARWRVVWALLLLVPILSICLALYINFGWVRDASALLPLTGLFILDVAILFWLPTATSSPGHLMYAPMGSSLLRRLVGS
jgi:hypothetical protein